MSTARIRAQRLRQQRRTNPALFVIPLMFGGILLLVLLLAFTSNKAHGGNTPEFAADTLTGNTIRLSDYRGQIVMLNFWATWCPPCRAEMPNIQNAYDRYRKQGFVVLAINNSEPSYQVAPFVDSLSLQFPVILDPSAELQRSFNITGYPTSIFLDRVGKTYATHYGMLDENQLQTYIEAGLALKR